MQDKFMIRLQSKAVTLSFFVILLVSCQQPDNGESFRSAMKTYFNSIVQADGPGGAVLVMKDTTVIYTDAIGWADMNTKEPITTRTLFNLGSISKTFVSNGILMLQQQGKLSVEDSLLKYFPNFKNKEIARKVKIKHLLTHTSGLPDNRQVSKDSVFFLTANDEQNWYPVTQTDTLEFEPGTRYQYSNPAFNALALIIQQVTGMPWQRFISETIFVPSGMKTSTITDGPHPQSGVSHGYTKIAGQWLEDDFGEEPTFCAAGNGGVWSSVEELARYELALRRATFLDKTSIDSSFTIRNFSSWKGDQPPFIGWSWFIDSTPDNRKVISHTGHQGGFAAYYMNVPEEQILIVVLFNAPYDVYAFRENVMTQLAKNNWLNEVRN
ncbi:MAG: beta-lactamase family protein [Cyclobacteriaceae bacterium]|nr:beta-lactamase family protein [Cyclobacteriaceae bacterium]